MFSSKTKIAGLIIFTMFVLFVLASFFWPRSEQISGNCHPLPNEAVDMINRNLLNTGLFIDNAFYINAINYKGYYVASSLDDISRKNTVLVWLANDIHIPVSYLSISRSAKKESKFQEANIDQIANAFEDRSYLKIRDCVKKRGSLISR